MVRRRPVMVADSFSFFQNLNPLDVTALLSTSSPIFSEAILSAVNSHVLGETWIGVTCPVSIQISQITLC
jgi:hypothetical protein